MEDNSKLEKKVLKPKKKETSKPVTKPKKVVTKRKSPQKVTHKSKPTKKSNK